MDIGEHWGERDPRWEGVVTHCVEVQGTPVRVLRTETAADGTPHLMVHGLGGSATNWLDLLGPMSRHGPVLATDLPGFGETAPPTSRHVHVGAQVGFVGALCRELGWDRVVLHGNSMGGLVALLVAAERPDLVERLVLVSPAVPTPRLRALDIPLETLWRFAPFVVPGLGERMLRRGFETMSPEELVEDTLEFVYGDPRNVRESFREVSRQSFVRGRNLPWRVPSFAASARSLVGLLLRARPVLDAVERVTAPTLVVWGREDRLVVRSGIDVLTRRRPEWRIEILPRVGHVPMVESAERHVEVLESWLRAAPARTPVSVPLRSATGTA